MFQWGQFSEKKNEICFPQSFIKRLNCPSPQLLNLYSMEPSNPEPTTIYGLFQLQVRFYCLPLPCLCLPSKGQGPAVPLLRARALQCHSVLYWSEVDSGTHLPCGSFASFGWYNGSNLTIWSILLLQVSALDSLLIEIWVLDTVDKSIWRKFQPHSFPMWYIHLVLDPMIWYWEASPIKFGWLLFWY